MATRSTISIVDEKGNGRTIYCHWDGYPSHNGKILKNHYNTVEKVNELINLGNLSILGEERGKKVDFDTYDSSKTNQCLSYHRDRGESIKNTAPTSFTKIPKEGEEYDYLFKNNKWYVRTNDKFVLLTNKMINK